MTTLNDINKKLNEEYPKLLKIISNKPEKQVLKEVYKFIALLEELAKVCDKKQDNQTP